MIIKLAFILFMLPCFLPAQNLTGKWTGTANFGAEYVELVIVRDGDRYIGYTYDTGGGGYCKVNFEGKFDSLKQKLRGKGMGFIEKTFGHSQCVFNLDYFERNETALLKGSVLPKSLAMNIMALGITAFTRVTLTRKSLLADTTAFMSQALRKSNKNVGSNKITNT